LNLPFEFTYAYFHFTEIPLHRRSDDWGKEITNAAYERDGVK